MPSQTSVLIELYVGIMLFVHLHVAAQQGRELLQESASLHAERSMTMQGEEGISLQPISRFQVAAVGNMVYIHTHRSLNDILVLDVANPDEPKLKQVPVSGNHGATPSARWALASCFLFHLSGSQTTGLLCGPSIMVARTQLQDQCGLTDCIVHCIAVQLSVRHTCSCQNKIQGVSC